jgi:hypothetical protein
MPKVNKNSEGFSAIEAILIFFIVAILGFVGWYVWQVKQKTDKTLGSAKTTNAPAGPYLGWKTYTNTAYKFSYKYPSTWVVSDEGPIDPTGNANKEEFGGGLKLPTNEKYNNTVNVEVLDEDIATATAWYDIYYGQSPSVDVTKMPGTLKGKDAVSYLLTYPKGKSKSYVINLGTKTLVFSSVDEPQDAQAASTYWATFDKVFNSLRIN